MLVLKGIYHYWKHVHFFQGAKQMEVQELSLGLNMNLIVSCPVGSQDSTLLGSSGKIQPVV